MALDQLLLTAAPWLGWSGLALGLLTVVAFVAGWGLRFRLVGVSSFTLLLSVSCWAFAVSYSPPVRIEGAVRVPIVFDNGEALVVAQAPAEMPMSAVTPTLEQLAGNLRGAGRSSRTVQALASKARAMVWSLRTGAPHCCKKRLTAGASAG